MANFALLGVAGFVAPRHLEAIKSTGQRLVAAADPHDAVGILDRYFPDAEFFTDQRNFANRLLTTRNQQGPSSINYVAICTPNDFHAEHVELTLKSGADAICEKPLVVDPKELSDLRRLEMATGRRVFTIMQLRYHPAVAGLKQMIQSADGDHTFRVRLNYVTRRGAWYRASWKGKEARSGGLAINIGIHLFDLLLWLFGPVRGMVVDYAGPQRLVGKFSLERAEVDWLLSIDSDDLPLDQGAGSDSHRAIVVDGREVNLTSGFHGLHSRCYEEILAGRGMGIDDVRPSLELANAIRRTSPVGHPQP